jgi:hypothetical protein
MTRYYLSDANRHLLQVLVPAATIAILVTPDTTIATCVALSLAIRAIGGSIGYAVYYNAFVGTLLTNPAGLAEIPGVTPEIIEAGAVGSRWAYAESLKMVWLVSTAFGACAIIACLFLGNTKKYATNRIAAHVE